jgi:hypothetical protein
MQGFITVVQINNKKLFRRQNIRRKEIIADGKTVTKEKAGSQLKGLFLPVLSSVALNSI